jgi:hypothetical protein
VVIMTAATIEETVQLCNDSHYQLKGIASFSSHRFACDRQPAFADAMPAPPVGLHLPVIPPNRIERLCGRAPVCRPLAALQPDLARCAWSPM